MPAINRRSVWFGLISAAVGLALIVALVKMSHVDLKALAHQFLTFDRLAFARLTALMGINILLSTLKWRLIDKRLRGSGESVIPVTTSFAVTAIGVALGQILPVQVSVSLARTLGTWANGRAVRRGTVGTLFEQGFDFLTVCFLGIATVGMFLLRGGAATWLILAIVVSGGAMATVTAATTFVGRLRVNPKSVSWWTRILVQVKSSQLLDPILSRQLIVLSLLRFVVLVLMAGETTKAIHSYVPLWHFACVMPFVVIASSLGTPGGLGLNEFTYATLLSSMGSSLAFTTQWALANRVLTSVGTFIVAAIALLLLGWVRIASAFCRKKELQQPSGLDSLHQQATITRSVGPLS